ncbi:hypothetical protein PIB30_039188 [Stylosanthes scabra]|uniref:NF-X1-type zinc finger protein NFXL1 n=1 Tax=Stylosanthes scabra TaxID=79078 RepID=A0ABU6YBJ9_9FABA|nr:hypothetical protein [Stylosanthes scabra]
MSVQAQRDRRSRSRVPPQGGPRQEWVPRGSSTTAAAAAVQPSNLQPDQNAESVGSSSNGAVVAAATPVPTAPPAVVRHNRSNQGPVNQRREMEKGRSSGNQAGKGSRLRDSSLPQLVQEIQEKLMKGTVECMICYDMVRRSAPVWSCSSCYSIFHLNCIKKWARAPTSIDLSAEKNQGFNWRCPGCQSVQLTSSKEIRYVCFCGKRVDPPSDLYLTPHSCGEPCGKPLEREVLVLLVKHLPLHAYVPVRRKQLPHDVLIGNLFLHVASGVRSFSSVGVTDVNAFVTWELVIHEKLEFSLVVPIVGGNLVVKCRCGSTSRTVECYRTTDNEKFTCEKPCGRKKNCGRHRCSERCCPLSNPNNNFSGEWDPHFCSMPCEKKLRCGQHACESLCHSGHCPPCLETIFTDLTCACGRTSIPPPLPCGTPPPSCQLPCSVPQPCGHIASHSCHFGDCPPCSVPVAKECIGGHVVLRNIPCGSKDIRCNTLCGKTRQCGLHACGRTCHPPPCDNLSCSVQGLPAPCGQTCGAPRRDCRHTCTAPCHPSSPCPDVRCEFPVTITCCCGRITASVPCDAGGSSSNYNADAVHEASITQKLPIALQPVDPSGKKVPLGQRKLMCDDECAKLERKREKRDAVRVIAERWKLAVSAAGWEPKRFIVVHVTPKSKAPIRVLGVKGTPTISAPLPPAFDPLVDMDPRLVVSFPDLPREADISALVLRFGGECELVWLNDKNALAVFHDPARAATAMRRLDHGTFYQGAVSVVPNVGAAATSSTTSAWGGGTMKEGALSALKGNAWKKAVVQESGWREDSWGDEEWTTGSANVQQSAWKKEAPIAASFNRWNVLDHETGSSSSSTNVKKTQVSVKNTESSAVLRLESQASGSNEQGRHGGNLDAAESSEVVDDWEKAYE